MRTIAGNIPNPNNQALVGAKMIFTSLRTVVGGTIKGAKYKAETDEQGDYAVDILAGTYRVDVLMASNTRLFTIDKVEIVDGPPTDLFALASASGSTVNELQELYNQILAEAETLIGPEGDSAYQVAVNNGFEGTESEWLASLKGADGSVGEVASATGTQEIPEALNYRVVKVGSIAGLSDLNPINALSVDVQGYYPGQIVGGGRFSYDSSVPKADHDGISIISNTVPWNGSKTTLEDFQAGNGETDPSGSGAFVALELKNKNQCAGISPGTGHIDTALFQNLINYCTLKGLSYIDLEAGEYSSAALTNENQIQFIGEGAYFSDLSIRVGSSFNRGQKKYSLPPGFSWVPFSSYFINSDGKADIDFNVTEHAISNESVSIAVAYVDYENGNDANSGTINSPRKTLSSVFGLKSAGVIFVKSEDNYNIDTMVMDSTYTKPFLQIKSWSGNPVRIWNGPDPADVSWSVFSGYTYQSNPGFSIFGVFDQSILDGRGRYKHLTKRSTSAEVNSNPGSWFYDSGTGTLYVRRFENSAPGTDLLLQANGGINIEGNKALYIENLKFQSGNPIQANAVSGAKPRFYMFGGELSYSLNFGLDANGADTFIQDAAGYGCGLDNFNYHADATGLVECNAIEINVNSGSAGAINPTTPENKNASSMHDGGNILRINGHYSESFGPNIIDTTTGLSLNVGTIAENSIAPTDEQNRNFSIGASGFAGTMYCHSTTSKRSKNDYYAEGMGSELYLADCVDSGFVTRVDDTDIVKQYWP